MTKHYKNSTATFDMNFAEFFAGVGLVREGLASDEWNCVWANDISEAKKDTYIQNFGSSHFHLDDVWNVALNPALIPDNVFLYTASFPCTDMSVAGGRKGLKGSESGTLNAILSIIESKKRHNSQPRVVLLENVKGFLTSHKGDDVAYTVSSLNKLGYVVDIIEVDARSFTAQSRPRVFVIAVNEVLANASMYIKKPNSVLDVWWSHFDYSPELRSPIIRNLIKKHAYLRWGLFDIPKPPPKDVSLKDIVETDIPNGSPLWWNDSRREHLFSQMSELHKSYLETMVAQSTLSYGTVYRRMRNGKSMAELRHDGVAGCLRTPRGGSSKQILVSAGRGEWKVRLLTPREYARLQGVRDSFILPNNANKGYFAMGDAVCVPVIEYISKHILVPLYEKSESIKKPESNSNALHHFKSRKKIRSKSEPQLVG